jgi:hypothetical protein
MAVRKSASSGLPIRTSQRGDSGTQARISKVSRAGTKPQEARPVNHCERRDTPKQPAENRQADAGGRLVYWSRMAERRASPPRGGHRQSAEAKLTVPAAFSTSSR